MVSDSIFSKPLHRKESNAYEGFDYHGKILKNTMSNQIFENNATLAEFAMSLDTVVCSIVDAAKSVHTFNNIAIDKNDRSRN